MKCENARENRVALERPLGLSPNPSTNRKKRERLFPNKATTEPSFAYGSRVRWSLTFENKRRIDSDPDFS